MRVLRTLVPRMGWLALAFGALLSACQVDVEQPRPLPPAPGPDQGYCTREYAPVCARRGSRYENFSNSCAAEQAGYRVVSAGECGRGPDVSEPACPRNFDPVCASRGGNQRTFSNSCLAESAGFRVSYPGECGASHSGPGGPGYACTAEYVPVCARRGSRLQTFSNSCEAENAGFQIVSDGPC